MKTNFSKSKSSIYMKKVVQLLKNLIETKIEFGHIYYHFLERVLVCNLVKQI